ncbi:MAG: hypothetical protein AB9828_10450 [Sphaerochaetaceae bacterium]
MNSIAAEALWEKSLGSLNDEVYLNIVRNYLGSITTPFHKPQLTHQLTTVFSNEAFIDRIIACISPWDAMLLSATWLLRNPTQDELCALFIGECDYLSVQQSVVNLEERLLLLPAIDSSMPKDSLCINPLISERLFKETISLDSVFEHSIQVPFEPSFSFPIDRNLVRAVICLHAQGKIPPGEKGMKTLRSMAESSMFSAWNNTVLKVLLPLINRIFLRLGIISETARETILHQHACQELLRLSPWKLFLLLLTEGSIEQQLFFHTEDMRGSIVAFYLLFARLAENRLVISEENLHRICFISAARSSLRIQKYKEMILFLEHVGLLSIHTDTAGKQSHIIRLSLLKENPGQEQAGKKSSAAVTIDSDFSLSYTTDPVAPDGTDIIHLIAVVRKVDTVCSYEINKQSFRHALDHGCTLEEIVRYLQDATAHPIQEGLTALLQQWNEEFTSIRIYDGITVLADDRISRLIEGLPNLRSHCIATIAPGIFLFSRKSEIQWRALLSEAGAELLPHSIAEENLMVNEDPQKLSLDPVPNARLFESINLLKTLRPSNPSIGSSEPAFIDELRTHIKNLHTGHNEEEELLAKLSRKLILSPSQVFKPQGRSTTMTASGFDFQGKLNLCKAAVASLHDMLELHVVEDSGDTRILLAEANELIGTNRDFSLRVTILPEREEKVISIDKIFLVKKLKRSIFF